MITAEFFIKGLLVGFLIAAPVGPVAVMCIHRTIAHGRVAGYVCGFGAALADTIFGGVAALGLGFIASTVIAHQEVLRLVGGTVLVLLGIRLALSRHLPMRAERQEKAEEREERLAAKPTGSRLDFHLGNLAAAFAITITNPITLVSFAAVFTVIDLSGIDDTLRWSLSLVTGVFAGASLWWTLLVLLTGFAHRRISDAGILWVNRVSGGIIFVFGMMLLVFPATFSGHGGPAAKAVPELITPNH